MCIRDRYNPYLCFQCWNSFSNESDFINHKTSCHGNTSLLNQDIASSSQIQFVDCGETIKQEIKEETETEVEMKTLEDVLTVKSEICEDIVESDEISLESEYEAKSIDCKETIKLEIKQEIQETEDLQDPISTEDLFSTESFVVKMENSL